jgi:hypothetical protein
LALEQGIEEPPDAAKAYLKHETTTHFGEQRVDAFLANGPKAIEFFTKNTCVQLDMPAVFPDYHAQAAGGQPGGRSMVTRPCQSVTPEVAASERPIPSLAASGHVQCAGSGCFA